jgi:predicted nucleic acid-binding protein
MGQAFPFSSIDKYLRELGATVPGCLIDTNFLIASTEELHPFYDDAKFLFEKLAEYNIPIFTTVTTRAEFLDFRRKSIITEVLLDMLAPSSKWKISEKTKRLLRAQKTWIDTQAADDSVPILTDRRIKACKELFMPKDHSGHIGWVTICSEYLHGQLLDAWSVLIEKLDVNYIDMRDGSVTELIPEKLEWTKMYKISEETCLASSDAMLVNVLKCSKFPFIASADFDLAYSVLGDSCDKTVLVPDNLHYNKIKSLRF